MKLQDYFQNEKLNEGQKMDIYATLLNSVDTAIRIINIVMEEDNDDVKNIRRLQSAKTKLESAQHDIKMVPMEILKNVAVKSWNAIKSGISRVFT
jgi:hypothetical protein